MRADQRLAFAEHPEPAERSEDSEWEAAAGGLGAFRNAAPYPLPAGRRAGRLRIKGGCPAPFVAESQARWL